ncbi:MAG: hypothetical protein QNK37_33960 [Acidobacteriota bacterium]|nr:hypothetical protein [Acidobacteriota bacterium]
MSISAPARIDLAGGTLDIPPLCFFIKETLTLNLAVNFRVKITMEPAGKGRVHGPGLEPATIADLPLFDHAFEYFGLVPHWDILVENDIPPASGLGGSSAMLVALVENLMLLSGRRPARKDILSAVTVLENRLLGKPAGTQDGIAALFGGLNEIRFESGHPERIPMNLPEYLSGPIYMVYSKVQHHSGMNNWSLVKAACEGDARILKLFQALNENSHVMRTALVEGGAGEFLACLRREAELRDDLWPGLKTESMAGFTAGLPAEYVAKVCGAGGGGCMFVYTPDPDKEMLSRLAGKHGLELLQVQAELEGSCQS